MKITVLGAGAIGSAVAYDLCHHDEVTRVQVCEARPAVLRPFRAWLAHPKLRTYEADARDTQTLETLLAGTDCVVSCVAPELNPHLAALALRLGAHFVDLGGPEAVVAEELALDPLARARGRWVVPGAGLAPGLVSVLCLHGLAQFDRAHAARVRVGDLPVEPREPFNYRLAHAAEKLLDDYTQPVAVLRDGRVTYCPPLTGLETVEVEGFGPLEAFYAGGGLSTLPHLLEGQLDRLDCKTLRYPGHADQMRFLLDLGLAERTTLDVRTHLTYRDVLVRRLRQRLGGAYQDAVLVRVEIEGEVAAEGDGAPRLRTLVYEMVDRFDAATGLSAMRRCTAFPAAAAALLLAAGAVSGGGAAPLEQALPAPAFLDALAARGLAITSRWHDGALHPEPAESHA